MPFSRIDRAARAVNNGWSRNVVGRTCTTGKADQSEVRPADAVERGRHRFRPGQVPSDDLGAGSVLVMTVFLSC
ncbi:hypothetical protein ACFZAD_25900 [Streptomyces iakyrus]|uniref:hypothetical protein n=1 Tax=Streptomyces iakyrus TaxID=68219 RepID=UPI0036E941FF